MNEDIKDNASIRVPPPLFFVACVGFGLFLEHLLPTQFIRLPWAIRIIAGCICFLFSGYLAINAFVVLSKNKTPFDPEKPTVVIVREGVFGFSRNPMYLSLLVLTASLAILIASLWLFIAIPVLFFLLEFFAIKPEEKYLSEKFGEEFSDYADAVRRWL